MPIRACCQMAPKHPKLQDSLRWNAIARCVLRLPLVGARVGAECVTVRQKIHVVGSGFQAEGGLCAASFNGRSCGLGKKAYSRSPALRYHSAYESVALASGESSPPVCFASKPGPADKMHSELVTSVHIPPFFRLSSALAFLAASTNGASVLSGSEVWMNGC